MTTLKAIIGHVIMFVVYIVLCSLGLVVFAVLRPIRAITGKKK